MGHGRRERGLEVQVNLLGLGSLPRFSKRSLSCRVCRCHRGFSHGDKSNWSLSASKRRIKNLSFFKATNHPWFKQCLTHDTKFQSMLWSTWYITSCQTSIHGLVQNDLILGFNPCASWCLMSGLSHMVPGCPISGLENFVVRIWGSGPTPYVWKNQWVIVTGLVRPYPGTSVQAQWRANNKDWWFWRASPVTNVTGLVRAYLSSGVHAGYFSEWRIDYNRVRHWEKILLVHPYLHTSVRAQWQMSLGLHARIIKLCCWPVTGLVRSYLGTGVQDQRQVLSWPSGRPSDKS